MSAPRSTNAQHPPLQVDGPQILSDPDAALIRWYQAGGEDAAASFAELIARHEGKIRRRAARILGDDTEAEDVTQEVFVNLHRFLHRYKPDQPFGHWLSVVTLNACRVELRRRTSRRRRHDAYRRDVSLESSGNLETDPLLRGWLVKELDKLDPRTRDCIILRALDGLPYGVIAKRCGLSEPAAKMRVVRGLRKLKGRYLTHRPAAIRESSHRTTPAAIESEQPSNVRRHSVHDIRSRAERRRRILSAADAGGRLENSML